MIRAVAIIAIALVTGCESMFFNPPPEPKHYPPTNPDIRHCPVNGCPEWFLEQQLLDEHVKNCHRLNP